MSRVLVGILAVVVLPLLASSGNARDSTALNSPQAISRRRMHSSDPRILPKALSYRESGWDAPLVFPP